jgi:hypothetical protein
MTMDKNGRSHSLLLRLPADDGTVPNTVAINGLTAGAALPKAQQDCSVPAASVP